MKYYLLIFNDDYADEHDVPALACMTEDEYQKWLKTASGEKNEDYDKQLQKYKEQEDTEKVFWNILKEKGYTLNGSPNTSTIPKDDKETLKLEKEYREVASYKNRIRLPNKVNSNMRAYLGNSGEGFEESYSNYYLMEEFVEANVVKVLEVDENFYNTFHKAGLDRMSLCNVFEIDS